MQNFGILKNKWFLQVCFRSLCAILHRTSTSGGLRALLLIYILIQSDEACTLAVVWVGFARVQLETLSSLLKSSVNPH